MITTSRIWDSLQSAYGPVPELLTQTKAYTGFGGVYEDRNTLTDRFILGCGLNEYSDGKTQHAGVVFRRDALSL